MASSESHRALRWAMIFALGVLTVDPVSAQWNGAWEGYRDDRHRDACHLTHQVLTEGQPASERGWALRMVSSCGPLGGEAVAALLRAHWNATERTEEYDQIVLLAARLTDRSVYEAAMELSQDPEASELARIQSIRAIYYQVRPGDFVDYETFLDPDVISIGSTYHSSEGVPLPDDAFTRIIGAMEGISADPEASEPLRTAGEKARGAARARIWYEEECRVVALQECMRRIGIIPD